MSIGKEQQLNLSIIGIKSKSKTHEEQAGRKKIVVEFEKTINLDLEIAMFNDAEFRSAKECVRLEKKNQTSQEQ